MLADDVADALSGVHFRDAICRSFAANKADFTFRFRRIHGLFCSDRVVLHVGRLQMQLVGVTSHVGTVHCNITVRFVCFTTNSTVSGVTSTSVLSSRKCSDANLNID